MASSDRGPWQFVGIGRQYLLSLPPTAALFTPACRVPSSAAGQHVRPETALKNWHSQNFCIARVNVPRVFRGIEYLLLNEGTPNRFGLIGGAPTGTVSSMFWQTRQDSQSRAKPPFMESF